MSPWLDGKSDDTLALIESRLGEHVRQLRDVGASRRLIVDLERVLAEVAAARARLPPRRPLLDVPEAGGPHE